MSQILQNVIAFLPYAYRTRTLFGEGTYGRTLLIDIITPTGLQLHAIHGVCRVYCCRWSDSWLAFYRSADKTD